LDRPAGLPLNDRCALPQSAADAQIVDLQADKVTPPQFAVDRQVEHCEVSLARLDLKASADIPDFLRLEGAFLTHEPSLVPRRLPMVLLLGVVLGHGSNLPFQPLPPQLPALCGPENNAQAALTLQAADNSRSIITYFGPTRPQFWKLEIRGRSSSVPASTLRRLLGFLRNGRSNAVSSRSPRRSNA
jgi:hypothetical protein